MRVRRSPRTERDRNAQRSLRRQLERVIERQEETERELVLVKNTLKAVAEEGEISISGPCNRCDRSLLLIRNGILSCSHCGYKQSL